MSRGASQTHPVADDPRVLGMTVNEDIDDACTLATACVDRFAEDGNPDNVDVAAGLLREVVDELEALCAHTKTPRQRGFHVGRPGLEPESDGS
jgi:hypothetical protein